MVCKHFFSRNESLINLLELIIAAGLVLFLVFLNFHLVIKKLIPGPLGTYWKEILFGLVLVAWGILSVLKRRFLLSDTSMDIALLAFSGYVILRLILARFDIQALWGFYYSIMYLPIFWIVVVVLRRYPSWFEKFVWLLLALGSIVAIGGIVEFILDRSLWPSSEIILRQGFPDVYIYGTHLRRVYFVFDSPTTLANTLSLILPLALSMVYATPQIKAKLFACATALVMITCIGFTFSRGIWVASAIGLVVTGFLVGFSQRNKPLTFGLVGLIFLSATVWIGITTLRTSQLTNNDESIEITTEEYRNLPIQNIEQDFLTQKPAYGNATLQNWTLFDPISDQNDQRTVLYAPTLKDTQTEIIYQIKVSKFDSLKLAIALSPEVWSPEKGDGVDFQVYITTKDQSQSGKLVLNRYINPKINPSDRHWRNYLLNLSPWAGKEVNISFVTNSGPSNNWDYDWAGWADISVVRLPPGFFSSKPVTGDNIVLQYFRSISNWVNDQTNLDRLSAWNLSLTAWRKSPIWGTGLGTTGLAGFRVNSKSAFVTESQVLKILTELGIPGLILFAYIWYSIVKMGIRTVLNPFSTSKRVILFGILASLLISFIEGFVYQNLEVKQVNAIFWTLTGMLVFLSTLKND